MNSRQRARMALNHQEPDKIPFDLGGTVLTSINVHAYRQLRQYMGLPEKFVEAIQKSDAQLVGLSALLTTTMPMMRNTIQAMENAGVRDEVKVMVGGAGVTQEFADDIGADGYAPDASAAVRKAKDLLAVSA